MQIESFYGWAHLLVAAIYLGAAWNAVRRLRAAAPPLPLGAVLLPLAVVGHGVLLGADVFGTGSLRFGFAQHISATLFAAAALLWLEGRFLVLDALYALAAPLAAVGVLLPLAFHGVSLPVEGASLALRAHLTVSVLAYSLFTVAILHGILMNAITRRLHRAGREPQGFLEPLLEAMPPLLSLESLLFRQLLAGFLFLTASLLSGVVFSEQFLGRPLRFDHKTVFAFVSWLVFAGLLVGRYAFGWRGRVAQRWLVAGFLMLVLAYVGSRFVFEVVLGRGWV